MDGWNLALDLRTRNCANSLKMCYILGKRLWRDLVQEPRNRQGEVPPREYGASPSDLR